MENQNQTSDKVIGILAYITIFGLIIAFIMNQEKKDPFGSYHIRQALGIFICSLALSAIAMVPFVGWAVAVIGWLLILVLWVMGLINAISGNMKPVPVLGEKFEEWFKTVG
ncbi:MAG: hypothetical protein DHS20C17_10850 [Cyclobacteriaceae bacterium]|nr:MAG: hypothetical protein DHS20C17_10850 [Cyclobacteriaceae bacterium]